LGKRKWRLHCSKIFWPRTEPGRTAGLGSATWRRVWREPCSCSDGRQQGDMALSTEKERVYREVRSAEKAVAGYSAEASALWISEGGNRTEGARLAGEQKGCSAAKGLGIAAFTQDTPASAKWNSAGFAANGRPDQSSAATASDTASAFAVHGFHRTFV